MNVVTNLALFLGVVLSVGVTLIAHEATHLCVARLIGEPSVSIRSWVPLRLNVDFGEDSVSPGKIRLMAIAPTLIGLLFAAIFIILDGFSWLNNQDPYYLSRITIMYLILYSHISPADLRTFMTPH